MKFSYEWLQTYFNKPLPSVEEVARRLTLHSFEVDGVDKLGEDIILSIDVLPNRAHDCFSHLGVAREISALFGLPLKDDPFTRPISTWPMTERLIISIDDAGRCPRYSALVISGVKVAPSPDWLRRRLAAIGQRSINNIVDIANFVMLSIGQPLHVFDMAKLKLSSGLAAIAVRGAKDGGKLIALDGVEYDLVADDLVIADGNSGTPLAIAGVKGGQNSGVGEQTETIILESANFSPSGIRNSSRRLGLRTDASARFEHGLSSELTLFALREATELIIQIAAGQSLLVEGVNDAYVKKEPSTAVSVVFGDIAAALGAPLDEDEARATLAALGFAVHARTAGVLEVKPPFWRMDIDIPEDVVEEIGRMRGYDSLEPLNIGLVQGARINKRQYYIGEVRKILQSAGMSEVYTYAFTDKGDVEITKPVASDKGFMRATLGDGLQKALALNRRSADLLGLDRIAIFEIGTVFHNEGEFVHLGLAWSGVNRQDGSGLAEMIKDVADSSLADKLARKIGAVHPELAVEIDFDRLIADLSEPKKYYWSGGLVPVRFRPIAPFPYVLRDIALWVPQGTEGDRPREVIQDNAGQLLTLMRLIDSYEKDGRISYCFRLIFQSHERTLTDDEVNLAVWHITAELASRGWQVR